MDKYSDMFAEILFSLEKIDNTLRTVAGQNPIDCGFSRGHVPATEESLPLIASKLEGINQSLISLYLEEDNND